MGAFLLVMWLAGLPADGASDAEQLLRVVSYDRSLRARTPDGLKLAVLHDPKADGSRADADRFAAEVAGLQRAGSTLAPGTLETIVWSSGAALYSELVAKKISALYVAPGLSGALGDVIRAAEDAGVMTLASSVGDVEAGLAAGLGDGRRIVVNIGAAERCGVDFDPAVRQVARRVGDASPDPERVRLAQTLGSYRDAIHGKNIEALRALWPDLSSQEASRVKASMEGVRSHDVALALLRIEPDGARLRVRVRRTDRLTTREGEVLVSGRLMEILFRRAEGGAWLIESMAGV